MARTRLANIGGMLITANGMVSSSGVDLASQANAAYGQANSAYNAANTKLSSSGGTISGSLTVSGDLIVEGNTVTLNVATLEIEDNDIVLNANTTSTPTLNASITVDRGTSTNTFLRWNENTDKWGWSDDGTNLYNFSVALDAYAQANAAYAQANTGGNTSNLVAKTGDTMTGNLTFSGTGLRILGDMSNATWNNRLAFQTSTANSSTALLVIPNGTATISQYTAWGNSDLTNASYVQLVQLGATETRLGAGIQGTGTYTPITVYTGGSERMRITSNGNIGIGTSAPTNFGGTNLSIHSPSSSTYASQLWVSGAYVMEALINEGSSVMSFGSRSNHRLDLVSNDTTRMSITTGGDVGIGTTSTTLSGSPHRLVVQRSGFEQIGLNNGNNTNQSWQFGINDSGLGSAGRFNICQIVNGSTGGIGGGPSVPIISCEVPNAATATPRFLINNVGQIVNTAAGSNSAGLNLRSNGQTSGEVTIGQGFSNGTDNIGFLYNRSNAAFVFGTNNTERMRITSGGDVGIGTTTPTGKLNIYVSSVSNIAIGQHPSYGPYSALWTPGNDYTILWDATNTFINCRGGGLYLRSNNSDLLTIASNASMTFYNQMKTVTTTGAIAGGTAGNSVGFNHAGVYIDRTWGDYPGISVMNANGAGNTNQGQFRFHGTNASFNSYPGTSGGDFGVQVWSDGGFYDASDRRFKTNITTIPNALDKVLSMTGRRFQFINSEGNVEDYHTQNGFRFGFVAQELQDAGIDEVYRYHPEDDDGTEGYNKAYAVHYGSVTALLVEAIKELKADNDSLRSRLEALENK